MGQGVQAGMVRSIYNCKSGLEAFKQKFRRTTKNNNPTAILEEPYLEAFLDESYIDHLSEKDKMDWWQRKGKHVSVSIEEALVEGQKRFVKSDVRK